MTKAQSGKKTPKLEGLAGAAEQAAPKGLPPVHLWTPPLSGVMDMVVTRDGRWIHEGGEIRREGLVKLFASILKREEDAYFLVTPVEKWQITVEDAPFVGVDVDVTGMGRAQEVQVTTNLGDTARIDADHPLRLAGEVPYVTIRRNLEARLDRKSFYRLVDHAVEFDGLYGLWSGGIFFPLAPSEALEG